MGIATIHEPINISIKNDPEWYLKSLYIRSSDVTNVLMPVVSGMFLKIKAEKSQARCYMTRAFGLVRSLLQKDELHRFIDDFADYNYLAILLNFADSSPNRLLNQLVRHIYEIRLLRHKTTYFLADVEKKDLPEIYKQDEKLFDYICELPDVDLDTLLGRKDK
jgi:hypothetical protein